MLQRICFAAWYGQVFQFSDVYGRCARRLDAGGRYFGNCRRYLIDIGPVYASGRVCFLSGQMAVAYFMAHASSGNVLFPLANHGESAVLFCFVFLYLAVAGGGAWALDNAFGKDKD